MAKSFDLSLELTKQEDCFICRGRTPKMFRIKGTMDGKTGYVMKQGIILTFCAKCGHMMLSNAGQIMQAQAMRGLN